MITRRGGYLALRNGRAPAASEMIERLGYAVLRRAFDSREVAALRTAIVRTFQKFSPDIRRADAKSVRWDEFRYEMLNRSAACQRAVADRRILDVVEPLLGEDSHVIANTAWRNRPRKEYRRGGGWHVDAGPHVPRPPDVPWDERIPYPIFAIGVHVFLQDCPENCGPTAVVPGSHKSGQAPPVERSHDPDLRWREKGPVLLTAQAGDVAFFASDVWHQRAPASEGDTGRFFLQIHYGRRDVAQRLRPTVHVSQVSSAARKRAVTARARTVIGLHPPFFYDG